LKYIQSKSAKLQVRKDYAKSVLLSFEDFKEKGHMLQIVTIPPHTRQRLHFHKKQTEVYLILEGECIVNVDGKEILAKHGDGFICEPLEKHFLWNKTDKNFKLAVFKINLPKKAEDDSVWLEE